MEAITKQTSQAPAKQVPVQSATPLSALELNGVRLDSNHTVLTPEYLEDIKNGKSPKQDEKPTE